MQRFLERVKSFSESNPEEGKFLKGEMKIWAGSGPGRGKTNWDTIKNQILYRVQQHKTYGHDLTPEQFIDSLFEPNPGGKIDHEIIMARFQIG